MIQEQEMQTENCEAQTQSLAATSLPIGMICDGMSQQSAAALFTRRSVGGEATSDVDQWR